MNQFFYQITRKASDLINSDDYRERNITRQTAFTRNRKLSFPVMIVLLLNFLTRTMQIELDDFFANVLDAGTDSVTKQAFFKARKNILPDAFKELFLMTRDMVLNKNKIKRHKGYRILAIDGSELRLDKTKENKDIFLPRNHSPENKTNAEISLLYDVISHYVIDAQIGSIGFCEREYAKKNLAHFSSICDEKDIVIFDRGYPSRDMIATLTGMGCKYQYKANVNLMIGYFKYRLSAMLLFAGKALDICRQLILLCLKQPVPMIKGRSAPRPEFSHQRKVFCPKYSI